MNHLCKMNHSSSTFLLLMINKIQMVNSQTLLLCRSLTISKRFNMIGLNLHPPENKMLFNLQVKKSQQVKKKLFEIND